MRRSLALVQFLGFSAAGAAMLGPEWPRLVRGWAGGTIYPWWGVLFIAVGMAGGALSVALRDARWSPAVPAVVVVLAGQVAGLGLYAVKHWVPAFGIGGGYAGDPADLTRLAWVVALGGVVAGLAAVAQLVVARAFPVRAEPRLTPLLAWSALLILLVLPWGISLGGDPSTRDVTSLGAYVLIYSGPLAACVAGAAWATEQLRVTLLGSCAVAAALTGVSPSLEVTHGYGRPALLTTALLLGALAVVSRRTVAPGSPVPAGVG